MSRQGSGVRHKPSEVRLSPTDRHLACGSGAAPRVCGAPWRGVSSRADPGSIRRGRGSRLLAVASRGVQRLLGLRGWGEEGLRLSTRVPGHDRRPGEAGEFWRQR